MGQAGGRAGSPPLQLPQKTDPQQQQSEDAPICLSSVYMLITMVVKCQTLLIIESRKGQAHRRQQSVLLKQTVV